MDKRLMQLVLFGSANMTMNHRGWQLTDKGFSLA